LDGEEDDRSEVACGEVYGDLRGVREGKGEWKGRGRRE
jgi:hypothetical protein